MKILFIGDIVGKGGRKAVASALPEIKKKYTVDVVIANAENAAHGVGITRSTLEELRAAGIDGFTSGNHIWSKDEALELLGDSTNHLIRPQNYPEGPGSGIDRLHVGAYSLAVLNLQGQVFMAEGLDNPFTALDEMLKDPLVESAHAILVDFHAEATSEKVGFGWHADGRVSAVVGTHTHVATADNRILPEGTAFITDVGMCGARDSVIGVDKDIIVSTFTTGRKKRHEIPETGTMILNAVIIDVDTKSKKARSIERVDQTVEIH